MKQSADSLASVLSAYGFSKEDCTLIPFGSGLINHTWIVTCNKKRFILQRINDAIFKNPAAIAENIELIAGQLAKKQGYFFVRPISTLDSGPLFYENEKGWFRLFPFVEGSHTIDVVSNTGQAYEAALQFGRFTKRLSGLAMSRLAITLPGFHDLRLRYDQFSAALKSGIPERLQKAKDITEYLSAQDHLVKVYDHIVSDPSFKQRVTHHDTKISNVLFDNNGIGLCVIDLDTVMPGYFISDAGDMLRTYLSPVSEEEKDTGKIKIRDDYFFAVARGYLQEMQQELSNKEKKHFVYAGKFMIYMQALRFVTDYLNNDIYYTAKYETHNLTRAGNQSVLLQKFIEKEKELEGMVKSILKSPAGF